MTLCAEHGQFCVLYCEECSEFLCSCCIDTKLHMEHANRFCSMREGVTLLRAQSDSSMRRLRYMCAQTASSVAQHDPAHRERNVERQERELLELFSAVESVLASLKEECVRKFWAHNRHSESHLVRQRQQLRQMDRAIHLLQERLDDRECTAHELHKHWKSSRKLIDRISADYPHTHCGNLDASCRQERNMRDSGLQEGGSRGTSGRGGSDVPESASLERTRNALVREFFHSLHTQIAPARLCPWLAPSDDLGIYSFFIFN